MATIDVDELRKYMRDYYGTAIMSGFPAAALDLADVDSILGEELCELAEENGVDLRKFKVSFKVIIIQDFLSWGLDFYRQCAVGNGALAA